MYRIALLSICVATLGACSDPAPPAEAERLAGALSGDSAGAASDNPVCRLFSASELAAYAGEALGAGTNAAMGTGCQWLAVDGSGDVLIQIVPKEYHQNPSLAGYRELPGVGIEGNVSPFLDGWLAAAISGEETIAVSVAGQKASAAAAEALLREAIGRRGE